MAEEPTPLIQVELDDSNSFTLPTKVDLEEWLTEYKDTWGWVQTHFNQRQQPLHQTAQQIWNFITTADSLLKQLETAPSNLEHIKKQLANHFKNNWNKGWRSNSDPRNQYVLEQKEQTSEQASLMALTHFLNLPYQVNQLNQELLIALLNAVIFDQKLATITPSTKAALTRGIGTTENELSKLREQRDEHDQSWQEQLTSITDTLQKHDTNLQQLHDSRAQSLDKFVEQTKVEIEAFKKAHREEINLKEPVTFWESKQKSSFWTAIAFGVIFVIGLIAVGAILVKESQAIYEGLKLGDTIEYWRVAGMILLGGLSFWFLRILSKIFLSQLHAWSDAQERVVMVKTYLSLLQDEKALEPDDRRLVLEALFRPAPTGIIKDDGVPPALFDAITRLK